MITSDAVPVFLSTACAVREQGARSREAPGRDRIVRLISGEQHASMVVPLLLRAFNFLVDRPVHRSQIRRAWKDEGLRLQTVRIA